MRVGPSVRGYHAENHHFGEDKSTGRQLAFHGDLVIERLGGPGGGLGASTFPVLSRLRNSRKTATAFRGPGVRRRILVPGRDRLFCAQRLASRRQLSEQARLGPRIPELHDRPDLAAVGRACPDLPGRAACRRCHRGPQSGPCLLLDKRAVLGKCLPWQHDRLADDSRA